MDSVVKKSIFFGITGGFFLLIFFFGVLVLAESFSHAMEQFQILWYWILALLIGFGVQVGLWIYIRFKIKEKKAKGTAGRVVATGGISAGSMVACCAHHLVDVAPLLGFSVLFLFLTQYQIFFLILGILSNIIGIILMIEVIQKHSLYQEDGILNYFAKVNFEDLKKLVVAWSVVILFISFFGIRNLTQNKVIQNSESLLDTIENRQVSDLSSKNYLPSRENEAGGLSIEVTPIDFSSGGLMQFEIALTTHQGDLDFDLTQKSILVDNLGNIYLPLEWQGGRGGHHLSGKLIFSLPKEGIKQLRLIIKNIYDIDERIFEWNLE